MITRLPLRVAFMGTSDFAIPSLTALITHHQVVCVYTKPPRLAGHGIKEKRSPVHELAAVVGLPIRTPQTWHEPIAQQEWKHLSVDIGIVAAYGLILPESVLAAPKLGCVNVHASLLPRWRGAAPVHRAVMAGDSVSGVSVMRMSVGLDSGPILLTAAVPVTDDMTAGCLHDILAHMGACLLLQAIDGLSAGTIVPKLQSTVGVTYAQKIIEDESHIDWTLSAINLSALIRGLSPRPGAFCNYNGTRLRVLMAKVVDGNVTVGAIPGTVLDNYLTIACGIGTLRLMQMQRPGKIALPTESFLRGYQLRSGTVLS